MTANRRAELQRKLAMKPVEKPPAGLSTRIKSDIPKELRFNAENERRRFTHNVRLSLAAAASVVVVIATAYLALQETKIHTDLERSKPAAAASRDVMTPATPVVAPQAVKVAETQIAQKPQSKEQRARKQQEPEKAKVDAVAGAGTAALAYSPEVAADAAQNVAAAPAAARIAAQAPPVPTPPVPANEVKSEVVTRSPVSGKLLVASPTAVMDAAKEPAREENVKKWKDVSPETKIQILKEELARGADPEEVARVAREAGLNEFADSIDKKQH